MPPTELLDASRCSYFPLIPLSILEAYNKVSYEPPLADCSNCEAYRVPLSMVNNPHLETPSSSQMPCPGRQQASSDPRMVPVCAARCPSSARKGEHGICSAPPHNTSKSCRSAHLIDRFRTSYGCTAVDTVEHCAPKT